MEPASPPTKEYWQYFIALEADFYETIRFVDLHPKNFDTFSIEFVQLLLRAGSEIDTLFKVYFDLHSFRLKNPNINGYRKIMMSEMPRFSKEAVSLRDRNLKMIPWNSWENDLNPEWWRAYNDVKHERHLNFEKANLKNVLEALAGLFVLAAHLYSRKLKSLEHTQWPKLFNLSPLCIQLSYTSAPIDPFE